MPTRTLNVLHAIHDFLPRHRAGSEVYALNLCRELQNRCHVSVLCADYDPSREHGSFRWRLLDGVPVVEIANNWEFRTLADTYHSAQIGARLHQVLDVIQPDVVHIHSLLNLTFDLPALAQAAGIPVVATLHDYTLVCASGGQRLHRAEQHVCHTIDVDRCARCFQESAFYDQMTVGRLGTTAGAPGLVQRLAKAANRLLPSGFVGTAARVVGRAVGPDVTPADIERRLDAARSVFQDVDVFVAPSASLAKEYVRLGLPADKMRVSDYGFPAQSKQVRRTPSTRLQIGYVGSIVWHKGVHVLIDAAKLLRESDWDLKVFGDLAVSPEYASSLRRAAEGQPVQFMGRFDQHDTGEVFAQIDVLVVPSLWLENSPLVIHEAFMAGVPVIGARIGGIVDLVRDQENGLLYDPSSPAALADAISQLLVNRQQLMTLADRAPAVKSIEDDAEEWERTYADLIESGAR